MVESSERRRGPRHRAYLAAEIEITADKVRIAITKDVSESGLLLLTRTKLTAGQAIKLKIHRPGDEERPLELSGKVVRREPLGREEIGTWHEKVALAFDRPQPELAAEFAALSEAQTRLSTIPPPFEAV